VPVTQRRDVIGVEKPKYRNLDKVGDLLWARDMTNTVERFEQNGKAPRGIERQPGLTVREMTIEQAQIRSGWVIGCGSDSRTP